MALALTLVLEGLLPFINPRWFRQRLNELLGLKDQTLRIVGLISMLSGVLLLYIVH